MLDDPTRLVLSLDHPECIEVDRVGRKAATLAALVQRGLPVPDGFVCTLQAARAYGARPSAESADLPAAIVTALALAGDKARALRSSSIDEDDPSASFAGLYPTLLDVTGPAALEDAIRWIWDQGDSDALRAYRVARDLPSAPALAILVQRQLPSRVAGIATSIDLLTGEPGEVICAVQGPGAPLMDGSSDGEQWVIHGEQARLRHGPGVLTPVEAKAVARLVREVVRSMGLDHPIQIEWAFEAEKLYVLQARPTFGTPTETSWPCPYPGTWARHLRLGEWLGAPLTPLASTWLLPALEAGSSEFRRRWVGLATPLPTSVRVHGWYFTRVDTVPSDPKGVLGMIVRLLYHLARHPRRTSIVFAGSLSDPGTRLCQREWTTQFLPELHRRRDQAQRALRGSDRRRMLACVERLVEISALGFGLLSGACNAAWKAELLLAEQVRECTDAVDPRELLMALEVLAPSAHDVFSLDWAEPTAGEQDWSSQARAISERSGIAQKTRESARERLLAAVAPRRRRTLTRLLARAEDLGRARGRCVQQVTEAWPSMRRLLLRLGEEFVADGQLERAQDVFFLERSEITATIEGSETPIPMLALVARRRVHTAQGRLSPPLVLGELPAPFVRALELAEVLRQPNERSTDQQRWTGLPASPGMATGSVLVARRPSDLVALEAGEVLVTPVLTPAWVPLAAHAAAVVVATGNHLSHASILAREFGLPCVVGMGPATAELCTGDIVRVDGAAGTVEHIHAIDPC